MLYKPTVVLAFLNELNKRPKKSLSQNFLVDGNIVKKITSFCELKEGEIILEIGPGLGVLTESFLKQKAKVIAIEKDIALAKALKRLDCQLYIGDFFDINLKEILPEEKIKVASNLPYGVATMIICSLLTMGEKFSKMIFMVQKEVAKRICASPNSKEYGFLTLFITFFATPKYLCDVSCNCFFPKPKVTSTIISLEPKIPPFKEGYEEFFLFVKQLFSYRRKMIASSLRKIYGQEKTKIAFSKVNIDPKLRAENLSLEDFIRLFRTFS